MGERRASKKKTGRKVCGMLTVNGKVRTKVRARELGLGFRLVLELELLLGLV